MAPRLCQESAVQQFLHLFVTHTRGGDSEGLKQLLDPFLKIMRHSRRITVSRPVTAGVPAAGRPTKPGTPDGFINDGARGSCGICASASVPVPAVIISEICRQVLLCPCWKCPGCGWLQ